MTVRVAVVDDQTLFAETLRTALNTDPGVDVVAVLSSGAEFLKTVSSTAVDVALIDVDMPGMSGLETVRALADIPQAAAVQVVMLTVFTSPGVVRAALDARVAGFLGKNVHTRELLRAIRTAADGGRVVDPELAAAAALIGPNPLTETERRVLRCTQGGTDTQSIAAELLLTVGTVKNHLWDVIQKLGVHNRVEAFQKAQQNGWI